MNKNGSRNRHILLSNCFVLVILVAFAFTFLGCPTDDSTVVSVNVIASNTTVAKGGWLQFTAQVVGTNNPSNAVLWLIMNTVHEGTSISNGGMLTVYAYETATTITVRAVSVQDTSKWAEITVTVESGSGGQEPTVTSVVVSPVNPTINKGASQLFTAQVNGTNNPAQTVTWSVIGSVDSVSTITPTTATATGGNLTISSLETAATLTVRATSTVDATKWGETTVTINHGGGQEPTVTNVVVSPANPTLVKGTSQLFTAQVNGTNSPAQTVTWSVIGSVGNASTITPTTATAAGGNLTVALGETAATLTVRATSTVDTTKWGETTVTLNNPPLAGFVSISGTPQIDNELAAVLQNMNASGDYNFHWYRAVTNATNDTGTPIMVSPMDSYLLVEEDIGMYIKVMVTLTGYTGSIISNPVGPIANIGGQLPDPTVTSVVVNPVSSIVKGTSQLLSAQVNGTNNPSQTVNWTITSSTGAGTFINFNSGNLTVALGETSTSLTVRATSVFDPTKWGETTITLTTPGLAGTVSIGGIAQVGQTLTADPDLSGIGVISYQWKRAVNMADEGINIGTNSPSYTLQAADAGRFIKVVVTRENYSGSQTSNIIGPIEALSSGHSVSVNATLSSGIAKETITLSASGQFTLLDIAELTVNGSFSDYRWYINGILVSDDDSLYLSRGEFSSGKYRVLVIVSISEVPYSQEIIFIVE